MENSFTESTLYRASLQGRRDGNGALDFRSEVSQRRYNNLRAFGEPTAKNSNNAVEDPNGSEKLFKSKTEDTILEYTSEFREPDSDLLSIRTTVSDPKYDHSDKWLKTTSSSNETASFDEKEFLVEALGNELYNLSLASDETYFRDRTNSDFSASDLISVDSIPLQREVIQALSLPAIEPSPPKRHSALNRSKRMYRSLTQRIKNKFRPVLKVEEDNQGCKPSELHLHVAPTNLLGSDEIEIMQDLLQEVKVQQTCMGQAAKALHSCDSKTDLLSTSERVESERLLLVASLRRKAALEAIKGMTLDEDRKESTSFREKAEVTVSNIRLYLRNGICTSNPEGVEWFVVIVAHGLNVWASSARYCSTNENILQFNESISIPDLTPDFKITFEVYSLKLGKVINCSEGQHRISKQSRSTSCLPYSRFLTSPKKFFKKTESTGSPKLNDHNAWKSRMSSFVLAGCTEFSLEDLTSCLPWSIMPLPRNSSLSGTVDLNLACRLHLAINHDGFLDFYEDIGGFAAWNRWWCVLKGHTLMFWNYPGDQDVKEPLKIIELVACISDQITTVDRTICSRPRTLLIETERSWIAGDKNSMTVQCSSTSTIIRNLLSYDSAKELNEWSEKLNHVLLVLEEWNIIGQRTGLLDSE